MNSSLSASINLQRKIYIQKKKNKVVPSKNIRSKNRPGLFALLVLSILSSCPLLSPLCPKFISNSTLDRGTFWWLYLYYLSSLCLWHLTSSSESEEINKLLVAVRQRRQASCRGANWASSCSLDLKVFTCPLHYPYAYLPLRSGYPICEGGVINRVHISWAVGYITYIAVCLGEIDY